MPVIDGTYSPVPGVGLRRLQHLQFDTFGATDPIYAVFDDGSRELVWDGEAFHENYLRGSALSFRTDHFHFVLRRVGGWPTSQVRIVLDEGDGSSAVDDLVTIL